jgi:hypothetical protein
MDATPNTATRRPTDAAMAFKCETSSGRTVVVCIAPGAAGRQALREIRRDSRRVEPIAWGDALDYARSRS